MKYMFLKPFGHKDSSGVCSFVQIHPYFFTIVSASIFLLTLADFACTFMIFKKMLLCRDGCGKNYVCHLILHDLGVSKKYILSVLEIFMVIKFPAPCGHRQKIHNKKRLEYETFIKSSLQTLFQSLLFHNTLSLVILNEGNADVYLGVKF